VADRFHVIRLVNQHFLNVWNQQDPVGRKNRGLLSPCAGITGISALNNSTISFTIWKQFPILKASLPSQAKAHLPAVNQKYSS
jgi:hypothetical protein